MRRRALERADLLLWVELRELPALAAFGEHLGLLLHPREQVRRDALRLRVAGHLHGAGAGGGELLLQLHYLRASIVTLLHEPGEDTASGIVLVQGVTQLLPDRLNMLLELAGLRNHGVPLGLKERQQPRNARRR